MTSNPGTPWNNNVGGSFFQVAMHEIGHLIGLGHDSELPDGTIMRGSGAGSPADPVFPGDHDIVHGQHLHRPDNRDVDMYEFTLQANGAVRIETLAERLANSSNLDTYLTLFRKNTDGSLEIISTNNDYFSSDSFIEADLTPGTYVVGVTAKGNQDYNPSTSDTGSGGVSQGAYQLRFDYVPSAQSSILDAAGTPIDGDGDGTAGGDFNFWFRAVAPSTGAATPGTPKTIFVDKGFSGAADGSLARPFNSLPAAIAASAYGDVIRVVGSLGADRRLSTTGDNPAYEIGRGGVGNVILSDGAELQVPKGVTLMVDSGAIFKLGGSRIVAGSSDAGIDTRFSSVQVLGTPRTKVLMTSYNDQSLGVDTNPLITVPQPGDWGGIEMHNDVDRREGRGDWERNGIFLNYIANADLRFGGGSVVIATNSPVANPIHMRESRPTLLYNTISRSADSAMSADPNSFEETQFTEPRYQLAGQFRSDYNRVGPDIRGNDLQNNSINALFIRVPTLPGNVIQTLDVQARLNETDITYYLGEQLIITGTPGGAFSESIAPDVSLVRFSSSTAVGTLTPTVSYNYILTFVDRFGGEGIQSVATANAIASASGSINLNQLPVARGEFVSRRLWRSSAGGAGPYTLVAELDRESTSYPDVGASLGAVLPPATTTINRARPDGRLRIDPGVILKFANSRIEVGIGAQLIAEGTPDHQIIFTSRFDDTYGAGGTFDTNNDGSATSTGPGQWGGIVARQLSSLSIDSARITFAGGTTTIPGGFAGFNAIELNQAEARIANSVFANNASGLGTNDGDREGRGTHDAATIFVRGSQPVIIDNIFRNNSAANSAAVSIDVNSLKAVPVQDQGRQTGANDARPGALGNYGPLVVGNRLSNNGLNGMRVRGATLTTESIWDDTDIVHVLQSEVVVDNFHTYGGLMLKSKSDESLVVKMGTGAGLTASGTALDITDRIGGSVQIIGSPGFPVILTALADDTVGAGFDPTGNALRDTNNDRNLSTPSAGAWRSVRLDRLSNDRNVATTTELESDQIQDVGVNDDPAAAQSLGSLAQSQHGGDENLRLGFTVAGTIASKSDVDVYSFVGYAGSQIWIDIDRTDMSLDSVVELIDFNGNIIAQSDNSLTESINGQVGFIDPNRIQSSRVQTMDMDPFAPQNARAGVDADFHSINPNDAGFRVLLPGANGNANTYFVRVRSSNVGPTESASRLQNPALLRAGKSEGNYRLQVRMQQQNEVGGSAVQYADIRFATRGLDIIGLPNHSPLLGTAASANTSILANIPSLGNLLQSDRGAFSLAGRIDSASDVDFYTFRIDRPNIQSGNPAVAVSIDVDYASGYSGPNTSLWLFRVTNPANPLATLVLTGSDSNIADDRSAPGQGSDLDNLSRGSFGPLDAYIGSQELPEGDYLLAVTNNSQIGADLDQFQNSASTNQLVRLQPITSVARIGTQHVNAVAPSNPETAGIVPTITMGNVAWTLGDARAFAMSSNGTLSIVNPLTGALIATNGGVNTAVGGSLNAVGDIAISPTGQYAAVNRVSATDAGSTFFVGDSAAGLTLTAAGTITIPTATAAVTGTPPNLTIAVGIQDVGFTFSALSFFNEVQSLAGGTSLFGVASRNGSWFFPDLDAQGNIIQPANGGSINPRSAAGAANILWKLDPNSGAVINPPGQGDYTPLAATFVYGATRVEYGRLTGTGTVTGMADLEDATGRMFAVSDRGEFYAFNMDGINTVGDIAPIATLRDPVTNQPIAFTGLSAGPRSLAGNILFGITANGTIYAFNSTGVFQPIFPGANVSVRSPSAGFNGLVGFDFSTLGTNLWHTTDSQAGVAGHGIEQTFDGTQANRQDGLNAFYFGWENANQGGNWVGGFANQAANTYAFPGGAHGAMETANIDLTSIASHDLPTLYFNYRLETENKNAPLDPNNDALDAFRVYGIGDDGVWRLLVTSNSADDGNYNGAVSEVNEIDQGVSRNVDPYSTPLVVQPAFATNTWRQARVNLSPFAGHQNVRLRFEFSTAASFFTTNTSKGGVPLTAVAGSRINPGNTFTISTVDQAVADTATFQYNLGLVLALPGASEIVNGVSALNINGTTLTFSTLSGPGLITYNLTDNAVAIAAAVRNALLALPGFNVATNPESPNILNVSGASVPAGGVYTVASLPNDPVNGVIRGVPLAAASTVVNVNQAMTAAEVRDAIRIALAARFNAAGQANNLNVWPISGNSIILYKYTATNFGPLVFSSLPGDAFGANNAANEALSRLINSNNRFTGVYLDDIIIGLAERGEIVSNAAARPLGTPSPQSPLFVSQTGRFYEPNGFTTSTGSSAPLVEQETGTYQVEIRTSAEYSNDRGGTRPGLGLAPINPPSDKDIAPRVFRSNDRLAQGIGLQFSAASGLRDGDVFTLSDGVNVVNFEFDIALNPTLPVSVQQGNVAIRLLATDTANQVAVKVRNVINAATTQQLINLSASVDGEMLATTFVDQRTASSSLVLLHGTAAITRGGDTISPIAGMTVRRWGAETAFGEDLGDSNRLRDQGMVIVSQSSFTSNLEYGVVVDAVTTSNTVTSPGSVVNFPTPNTARLAPGVVIASNIFNRNVQGGILVSGEGNAAVAERPSPVARLLNNTIYGVRTGNDVGIRVNDGAAPTILNNIIANVQNAGIDITGANTTSISIGANLYHDAGAGTPSRLIINGAANVSNNQGFQIESNVSPFLNTNGFFYLAPRSRAIDSSLNSLPEPDALTQVKSPLQLPPSPALAPDRDVFGQQPIDDPNSSDTSGIGANVFKDRGAVERADTTRLQAVILQPQDNDSANVDVDRTVTYIKVDAGRYDFFSVLLIDGAGTGPDEASVTSETVTITENGRRLIAGSDYVFGYDGNSHAIRLTPLAGIWRSDSVYEITLNNAAGHRLTVRDGAGLVDGDRFTLTYSGGTIVLELDSGNGVSANATAIPFTANDAAITIATRMVAAINRARVGLNAYLQGDGTFMVTGTTAVTAAGAGTIQAVQTIRDRAGNPLDPNRANSLTQFTIVMPDVQLDYGDADGVRIPTTRQPNSNFPPVVTNGEGARHALLPIDVPRLVLGNLVDADADGVPSPSATSDDNEASVSLGTLTATLGNNGSAVFAINRAAVTDGAQFTITDSIAHPLAPVVFEFNTDTAASSPTVTPIFVAAGDTDAVLAEKVASIINAVVLSGRLDNLIAVVDPSNSNLVRLVTNAGMLVDVPPATVAALTRQAVGDLRIVMPATISVAMDGQQFSVTDGNGRIIGFELNHVAGPAIPTAVTPGFVPVNLDLSTATSADLANAIAAAIQGVVGAGRLTLAPVSASGASVVIRSDDEDGVSFAGVFNAQSKDVIATVISSGNGVLDAWIDWNGNGEFSDDEREFTGFVVQAGINTFPIKTPLTATVGFVNARFRLSTLGSTLPSAVAIGGEVEDYVIEVIKGAPPIAVNDPDPASANQYVTAEDNTLVVSSVTEGVLGNDTDPDNDPVAIPPVLEPRFVFDEDPSTAAIDPLVNVRNGQLTLNIDGTFTYVPNLDFNGTDTFVYNVVDQRLKSVSPATVTITVTPVNDTPLAKDDSMSIIEDAVINQAGSLFTVNDLAHFRITSTPSNADNEGIQVLTLINAAIVSEVTTDFGGIAGLGVRFAAKPGQGAYGIRLNISAADLGVGGLPTVTVNQSTLSVVLNSRAGSASTVNQLITAIANNAAANALLSVSLTSGLGSTVIGNQATTYSPLVVPPSGGTVSVSNGTLNYTPPAHYNSRIGGPVLLALTIQDDDKAGPVAGLTSVSTLTINVAAVNDRPEFDWTDPKIVSTLEVPNDNVGAFQTVTGFITGIQPGPDEAVDEALGPTLSTPENQQIDFDGLRVRALIPSQFAVQPAITVVGVPGALTATLTYQLAQDINRLPPFQPILVEVTAHDSGANGGPNNDLSDSIPRTFTIIPTEVNDAPLFDIQPVVNSKEDEGVRRIANFITNIQMGPSTALDEVVQTPRVELGFDPLAFTATGAPQIDLATGELTFETSLHSNRYTGQSFTVTVTVIDDGGVLNGGVDRTTKTFLIDVTELNDPPEYVMPATVTEFDEDPITPPPTTKNPFITAIEPGPVRATDEKARENQRVHFTVNAVDPSQFVVQPQIDDNGVLTYVLQKDLNLRAPFAPILVEVIAFDTGANDPGNAVPRNINTAAPRTFTILPNPINDAPEFTITVDPVISLEDQGVVTVTDFITGARPGPLTALDELALETAGMVMTAEALDPSAFTATGQPQIVLDNATGRGVLTYQTAPHINSFTGQDLRIRVILKDPGGTAHPRDVDTTVKTFALNVTELNDPPEYVMPATVTDFDEDPITAPPTTKNPFITSIEPGPAAATDEKVRENQRVHFRVNAVDPTQFVVQPSIDDNGVLTYVLQQDLNLRAPFAPILVEVIAFDTGANDAGNAVPRNINTAAPRTFTILPNPINDAPEFTITADPVPSLEDQGVVTVVDFITGARPGPLTALDELALETAGMVMTAQALDPSAFTATGQPTIVLDNVTGRGVLTYQTAAHVNNFTQHDLRIRVTLKDPGGTNHPRDVDTTVKTFSLNVTELNDPPEYVMPATVTDFDEDPITAPPTTKSPFITSIEPGPAGATDEKVRENQQVRFRVNAVDPSQFVVQPLIDDNGVLTYVLQRDLNLRAPFAPILVEVIAFDSGANDPGNAVPRNINTAAPRTFTILPNPINDAPEFTITVDPVVSLEDQGLVTVPDFITDARPGPVTALDELALETAGMVMTVEALDPTAFTATGQPQIVLNNTTGRGVLTYQTAPNINNLTLNDLRIRVTLKDTGGTAHPRDVDTTVKTFSLNVTPVNDVPSFTLPNPPSVTVDEDNESVTGVSPTQIPFATQIVAGPDTAIDETTVPATRQSPVFETVSVTNSGLFVQQPVLLPNGVLTFTTNKDRNGQSVVVIRLNDQGLHATANGDVGISPEQTFTINIRPINDPPEFDLSPVARSREDQGFMTIPNFATRIQPGPSTAVDETERVNFRVRALDPTAFSVQPLIAADGTLTYQTNPDVNSAMLNHDFRVEVFLEDVGTASPLPHNNVSPRQTFTIDVTPVNDAPSFSLPQPLVTVNEDNEQVTGISPTTVVGFANPIRRGPDTATDEFGQALVFDILSNSSPELFSIAPTISDTGVLSFRTAANKNGKSLLVVRLRDLGDNAPPPNVNVSPVQTFTIAITPVNDAPEFDIPPTITAREGDGLTSQNGFATNIRRGPIGADDETSQQIRFELTPFDRSAFSVQPTIGVDGTLVFQTAPNVNADNADLRVRVQLFDLGDSAPAPNTNASVIKTFTIVATPVNDPPIADVFTAEVLEETRLTVSAVDVLRNDVAGPTPDELSQGLSITQIQRTSQLGGTIIPVFSGGNIVSFDYIPPTNVVGKDTFLYVLTDQGVPSRSGTGTIEITILPVNDAPVFVKGNDQNVPEDAPLVTVNAWATGIQGAPSTAVDEQNQTVTFTLNVDKPQLFEVAPAVSSTGVLTFKPAADANGVAVVTIFGTDDGPTGGQNVSRSASQTFTITINAVNDAPVFTPGAAVTVSEDSGAYSQPWATSIAAAAGLLANPARATDESSQIVDFNVSVDRPNLFSVQPTINSSGRLSFTPNANAFGTAVLTVRAVDRGPAGVLDQPSSGPVQLTITITPVNDVPVAVTDSLNANENAVLNLAAPGLLANDTDVDLPNDTLRVLAATLTTARGATVIVNADGSLRYDPTGVESIQQLTTGQSIQDTFTYQIQDGAPATSAVATVTITVAGINDAPTANNDNFSIGVGQTRLLDVLLNDSDVDSRIDTTSISITALPAFGTVTVTQTGLVQYQPGGGFRGTDTFSYRVRDVEGNLSNEATATIVVNNAPTAAPDTASTVKNQAVVINVLANDSDADGSLDPTSVRIEVNPSPSGTARVLSDGRIEFTPATDFSGTASFSYSVKDNLGTSSAIANVTVRVQNSRWQNPRLALDVNNDTVISPLDALLVISYLNSSAPRDLRTTTYVAPPFIDVNGDEIVSPLDVLLVIDHLAKNRGANGEGEGEGFETSTDYAMMVTPLQMISTVGPQLVSEVGRALSAFSGDGLASPTSDSGSTAFVDGTTERVTSCKALDALFGTSAIEGDESSLVELAAGIDDESLHPDGLDNYFGTL